MATMSDVKEISRIPRPLSENYNFDLISRSFNESGSLVVDLIVFLANKQVKDLFGTVSFSVSDFCIMMGYDRTKLQRKLSEEQLVSLFGKNKPMYLKTIEGKDICHPIETVFEASLYKLIKENITYPSSNPDGSISYYSVQIASRLDINYDFHTKKDTKRVYTVVLSQKIIDSLFTQYNLIELADYKTLPDRKGYRYFYLNLSKMIYLIKYKIDKGEAPYFNLTVDQLARIFDINIVASNDRKKKVTSVLNAINKTLTVTNFQFSYIKRPGDKWAYTVQFFFPPETLSYFDEKFKSVFTKRFHEAVSDLYFEFKGIRPNLRVKFKNDMRNDPAQEKDFLEWIFSSNNIDEKAKIYNRIFVEVFGKKPEDMGIGISGASGFVF